MIYGINAAEVRNQKTNMSMNATMQNSIVQNTKANNFSFSKASALGLTANKLNLARSVAFTGSLYNSFKELNDPVETCKTKDKAGEAVGTRANISRLLYEMVGDLKMPRDSIKTTIETVKEDKKKGKPAEYARAAVKLLEQTEDGESQTLRFSLLSGDIKNPNSDTTERLKDIKQTIVADLTPINHKGFGTKEQVYVMNTKGNMMAVVEDGNNVLLTNAGKVEKVQGEGELKLDAQQRKNQFTPFVAGPKEVEITKQLPSIGEGTEIVIGMENGRFVNEIKASIQDFVDKIESGEIVLPQFKAASNAKDTQLMMLAGGFGSRAEYTNASSEAIFHGKIGGSQSTKGVFRTATGLTPMETTFVTLHKAGLLDCSKGHIGIGKNIKFYENQDKNRGNGEFSADLYRTMERDGRKSTIIFPNDSMSRMTDAVIEANKIMSTGKAAIAMIAKEVKAEDCIKAFGIMKLGEGNEILEFAEKPAVIPEGYEKDGMCLTNTFQFAVSDEAMKVLDMLEPFFVVKPGEKESRDWSKQYVPILMTLTQDKDLDTIREKLAKALGNEPKNISDSLINEAKALLGDQKIVAVPTSEPWADCGTLNQLYHTTMQIVSGKFKLEPFERNHAIDCVNTQTGLIASSKEQKEEIESKYDIDGQVMVVPKAKKVSAEDVENIEVTYQLPENA